MRRYTKHYPSDEFIRKFYYYNNLWQSFKNSVRHNINADVKNKALISQNKMRHKLVSKISIDTIKLPDMFLTKKLKINEK